MKERVVITHPEKVLFPEDGITKGELAAYYEAVAPVMLPHLQGRPVTLERYPAGIDRKGFWQKDVSRGFPAWLERVEVPKKDGVVHHPLATDRRSLAWMANQKNVRPILPSTNPKVWLSPYGSRSADKVPESQRAAKLCCTGKTLGTFPEPMPLIGNVYSQTLVIFEFDCMDSITLELCW